MHACTQTQSGVVCGWAALLGVHVSTQNKYTSIHTHVCARTRANTHTRINGVRKLCNFLSYFLSPSLWLLASSEMCNAISTDCSSRQYVYLKRQRTETEGKYIRKNTIHVYHHIAWFMIEKIPYHYIIPASHSHCVSPVKHCGSSWPVLLWEWT